MSRLTDWLDMTLTVLTGPLNSNPTNQPTPIHTDFKQNYKNLHPTCCFFFSAGALFQKASLCLLKGFSIPYLISTEI